MSDEAPPRRQLALSLGAEPSFGADDFVVGAANRAAWTLLSAWPDWPHPVTRLEGGAATGKTHLAMIWAAKSGAARIERTAITAALAEVVAAPGSATWLVEDADAGGLDETGLFHLINHAMETGGGVLVTARRPLAKWGLGLADLRSRLRAANLAELGIPDPDLLERLLVKLFADRQIEIGPRVAAFAAGRIERTFAAAAGLVDRLDRMSLEEGRRITVPLAARALDVPGTAADA